MIYFITNNQETLDFYSNKDFPNLTVLKDNNVTYTLFKNWAAKKYVEGDKFIGFDKETNGLDAWMNSGILDILGDKDTQFVFHSPYSDFRKYLLYVHNKFGFIGHNVKFDIKFAITENRVNISHVYDTMIAEQRLYMKSGLRFSLEQLLLRYLNEYPEASDKSIREEFINCDVKEFKVKPRHIYYAAGDVAPLFEIKEKQTEKIEKYDLGFLLYSIEFPLINTIAKAEIEGWDFNSKKWMEIYNTNLDNRFKLECKMDEEVRKLRDLVIKEPQQRVKMVGGKWDSKRIYNPQYEYFNKDGTVKGLDLFGEPMKINTYVGSKAKNTVKIKENPNNLNYGSDTQIIEIFGRLGEALMNDKGTLVVPQFNKNGKIDRSIAYRTGGDFFTLYKQEVSSSIMIPFVDMLLNHRQLSTAISTFGANVVNKLNKVTGKLHTEFRQANADTGRMQSGGGKGSDKINSQNIPSRAPWAIDMRNCFIAPKGYSIGTHDYSGAELIVMCSHGQDGALYKISKGDMHSYVAQKCWRNIYRARAIKMNQNPKDTKEWKDQINKFIKLSQEFIVDKTTGTIRRDFKPLTFGTIYGMYAAKAGKAAKVTKEEGQIIIDTIKTLFPKTFAMVESKANEATKNGFVILNTRTNSRAWFPNIVKCIQGKMNPKENFRLISKEQNEARNITIQGTQADGVKEATVVLDKYIRDNNIDAMILGWVHDEIIDKHPKHLDGKSKEWTKWIEDNPKGLTFITDKNEEIIGLSFPEVKRLIMIEVFNRYLLNVTIDVDYDVEDFWTK